MPSEVNRELSNWLAIFSVNIEPDDENLLERFYVYQNNNCE